MDLPCGEVGCGDTGSGISAGDALAGALVGTGGVVVLDGSAPTFDHHRFWAEADIATAFESFAQLFPAVQPPSGL